MAESKQYITQLQDNGSVLISEDVIAAIVAHAAGEVEGVVSLNTKPGADIAELIGKKNWGRGLKITILEDNSVSIDCNVTVSYGQSVVVVAEAVQTAVTNALETMAGVKIAAVNVNICGIVRQ
ncbi:MAG: Asp23/Gls24 family envelope stress response protein [Oscillospiraceae bacterium]|nr:Asp23/Gls24 family envelope stress response protein [Oscillospiraceae bacterium]